MVSEVVLTPYVETEYINLGTYAYDVFDDMVYHAALLYNAALYTIRHETKVNKKGDTVHLSWADVDKQFNSTNQPNYRYFPAKVAQNILRTLNTDIQNHYKLKDYYGSMGDEVGKAKVGFPKYKGGNRKFCKIEYNNQAIHYQGYYYNSKGAKIHEYALTTKKGCDERIIVCSRRLLTSITVTKTRSGRILISKISADTFPTQAEIKSRADFVPTGYAAIDLGVNNLITMVSTNSNVPIILSGGYLKSVNQFWNKRMAKLRSANSKNYIWVDNKEGGVKKVRQRSTKQMDTLTHKRNMKVKDFLHFASSYVVRYLLEHDINVLYIGYNAGWKQSVNLGKRVNQNFVTIPFLKLVQLIEYKAALYNIRVYRVNEAYTSKCSFLDGEQVTKHKSYCGSRICRGLFRTALGITWNADVNAAYNILAKSNENVVSELLRSREIEAFVVNPTTVAYQFGGNLIGCYGVGICDYACRVEGEVPLE